MKLVIPRQILTARFRQQFVISHSLKVLSEFSLRYTIEMDGSYAYEIIVQSENKNQVVLESQ